MKTWVVVLAFVGAIKAGMQIQQVRPADVDPSTPHAQCLARCCPMDDAHPEKYVRCLKDHDGPCMRDPEGACKKPPNGIGGHLPNRW